MARLSLCLIALAASTLAGEPKQPSIGKVAKFVQARAELMVYLSQPVSKMKPATTVVDVLTETRQLQERADAALTEVFTQAGATMSEHELDLSDMERPKFTAKKKEASK